MRGARRRALGVAIAALSLAGLLLWLFLPQPVAVELAEIRRGPLTVTVSEEGRTRIRDIYAVAAPIAGRLLRLKSEPGDVVAEGEVLAVLEPVLPALLDSRSNAELAELAVAARAARDLAAAELERARAELTYAAREVARIRKLARDGVASPREADQAERDLDSAEATVGAADAALRVRDNELAAAQARLRQPRELVASGTRLPLRAPVSGQVLRVLQESETVVAAGTPLLEIGDPRDLEIEVEMLTEEATRLRPGAAAAITRWGGAALPARVDTIEPFGFTKVSALGVEEQRVRVLLSLTEPPPPALGHGWRIEADIVAWQADAVLTVPVGALFRDGDDWAVFVVVDGAAAPRRLRLGHITDAAAEVLDGLTEGELVVLHPSDRVEAGQAVTAL